MISRIPGKHEGETYFPSFDDIIFNQKKKHKWKHLSYKSIKRDDDMKRIILVVLRCIFKLPYWWFYKLKQYQNKEKYPTIDEGYQFIHNVADEIVKKARVDLECYGLENLPQEMDISLLLIIKDYLILWLFLKHMIKQLNLY